MTDQPTSDGAPIHAFLTKSEIADRYRVTIGTIDHWMAARLLPYLKIGRVVRFRTGECDEAIGRFLVRSRMDGTGKKGQPNPSGV
jgi:hypothetical protein